MITYLLDSSIKLYTWRNACGRKGRVVQISMIIDMATLHAGTCKMSRVIANLPTGFIELIQWSNACERKGSVLHVSDHTDGYTPFLTYMLYS